MQFKLVVEEGEQRGDVFLVGDGDTLIGRSRSADIHLRQSDISARHLRISRLENGITAENLSRFGTLLDGKPLTDSVAVRPGQRLKLGKSVVLVLNTVPNDSVDIDDGTGEETGALETTPMDDAGTGFATIEAETQGVQATRGTIVSETADLGTSENMALRTGDADSKAEMQSETETDGMMGGKKSGAEELPEWEGDTYESEDALSDRTREIETRVPAPDEMTYLKESQRKRARNRVFLIVGGIILLLAGSVMLWPRKEPPEDNVEWPRNDNGSYIEERVQSLLGGFEVIYPGGHSTPPEITNDQIVINCRVGRARDVPLMFILNEEADSRLVSEDVSVSVARWKNRVMSNDGKWIFDEPLAMSLFIGRESGIPVVCIPYRRVDGGSWCGIVRIMRVGDRLITLRTETPVSERRRMEDLLHTFFLKPTTDFERGYWQGAGSIVEARARVLVDRAEHGMRGDAPSTWTDTQELLFDALRKATIENNVVLVDRAMRLLVDLRSKQAVWFNKLWFRREYLLSVEDEAGAEALAGCARAVFSSTDDRRYYKVRRW